LNIASRIDATLAEQLSLLSTLLRLELCRARSEKGQLERKRCCQATTCS
jgi:hypothetical protein